MNEQSVSATNEETLRHLARMIDLAEGFTLAFVKCNLPQQRRTLLQRLRAMLELLDVQLVELELAEPVDDLLSRVKGALAETKSPTKSAQLSSDSHQLTLFVYGLDHSLPSSDPHPPLLSHLNLARELYRRGVPHPLVLWLPDYALTKLARGAPDFWAWRSGVFEFTPEPEIVEALTEHLAYEPLLATGSLPGELKRERIQILERLLEDYRELEDTPRVRQARSDILFKLAYLHYELGEMSEARFFCQQSLKIARQLEDKGGIARTLHSLGLIVQDTGDLEEARRLYQQSLEIKRQLDDKQGIALTLHNLGAIAQDTGDLEEARRLYQQSLEFRRQLEDKQGIAQTLHQLGRAAEDTGGLEEARCLYQQSLEIKRQLGDKRGIAPTLHQLGRLAEEEGDLEKARELFSRSLELLETLGSPDAEVARRSLERVKGS